MLKQFSQFDRACILCMRNTRLLSTATKSRKKPILKDSIDVDWVGPADPDSNIRKIVYKRTKKNDLLTLENEKAYEWNNKFWKKHNQTFFEQKKEFIESTNAATGRGQDVSDKLSTFYKDFLENNQQVYRDYNREWYRRNFRIFWLTLRNSLPSFLKKEKT